MDGNPSVAETAIMLVILVIVVACLLCARALGLPVSGGRPLVGSDYKTFNQEHIDEIIDNPIKSDKYLKKMKIDLPPAYNTMEERRENIKLLRDNRGKIGVDLAMLYQFKVGYDNISKWLNTTKDNIVIAKMLHDSGINVQYNEGDVNALIALFEKYHGSYKANIVEINKLLLDDVIEPGFLGNRGSLRTHQNNLEEAMFTFNANVDKLVKKHMPTLISSISDSNKRIAELEENLKNEEILKQKAFNQAQKLITNCNDNLIAAELELANYKTEAGKDKHETSEKLNACQTEVNTLKARIAELEVEREALRTAAIEADAAHAARVAELQGELEAARVELAAKTAEVDRLTEQMQLVKARVTTLETTIEGHNARIAEMQGDRANATAERAAEAERLRADLGAQTADADKCRSDLAAAITRITLLEQQIMAAKAEHARVASAKQTAATFLQNTLKAKINQLLGELEKCKKDAAKLNAEGILQAANADNLRADLSGTQQRIKSLETQIVGLKAEHAASMQTISDTHTDMEAQRGKMASTQKELDECRASAQMLQTQLVERDKTIAASRAELARMTEDAARVRAYLEAVQVEKGHVENQLKRITIQLKDCAKHLTEYEQTVEGLREQQSAEDSKHAAEADQKAAKIADIERKIVEVRGVYGEKVAEAEDLRTQLASCKKDLSKATSERDKLQQRIEECRERSEKCEENMKTYTDRIKELEKVHDQCQGAKNSLVADINSRETEVNILKKKLVNASAIAADLGNDVNSQITEIRSLKKAITEKDAEIAQLNDKIKAKQDELYNINNQIKELAGLKQEITNKNVEIADLTLAIDTMQTKIANLNSQISSGVNDNEYLENTLNEYKLKLEGMFRSYRNCDRNLQQLKQMNADLEKSNKDWQTVEISNDELISTLQRKKEELETEKKHLETEKQRLETENQKLEESLVEADADGLEQYNINKSLHEHIRTLEDQIVKLDKENEKLKKVNVEHTERDTMLTELNEQRQTIIDKLNKENEKLKKVNVEHTERDTMLTELNEQRQTIIDTNLVVIERLKKDLAQHENKINDANRKIDELNAVMQKADAKIEKCKEKAAAIERDYVAINDEITSLRSKKMECDYEDGGVYRPPRRAVSEPTAKFINAPAGFASVLGGGWLGGFADPAAGVAAVILVAGSRADLVRKAEKYADKNPGWGIVVEGDPKEAHNAIELAGRRLGVNVGDAARGVVGGPNGVLYRISYDGKEPTLSHVDYLDVEAVEGRR